MRLLVNSISHLVGKSKKTQQAYDFTVLKGCKVDTVKTADFIGNKDVELSCASPLIIATLKSLPAVCEVEVENLIDDFGNMKVQVSGLKVIKELSLV